MYENFYLSLNITGPRNLKYHRKTGNGRHIKAIILVAPINDRTASGLWYKSAINYQIAQSNRQLFGSYRRTVFDRLYTWNASRPCSVSSLGARRCKTRHFFLHTTEIFYNGSRIINRENYFITFILAFVFDLYGSRANRTQNYGSPLNRI